MGSEGYRQSVNHDTQSRNKVNSLTYVAMLIESTFVVWIVAGTKFPISGSLGSKDLERETKRNEWVRR
jgi:hypothetical protein